MEGEQREMTEQRKKRAARADQGKGRNRELAKNSLKGEQGEQSQRAK